MQKAFLTGDSIYLRTIEESDLNSNYRDWFNDEDICRYNSHHRFPNYDEDMHEYYERVIRSHNNLVLAICDKKTNAHIGNIALENIDTINRSAELAIIIGDKKHWGKGIGKEASGLLVTHGFRELNLHRIYCGTLEDNVGMQNVARALGFREEGRSRDSLYKDGAFRNSINYGLLQDEFKIQEEK